MKIKMKSSILILVMLIFAVSFFTGCPGATPSGGTDGTPESNAALLQELGLTLDDDDPVNGNGEEVTGTMNPLGAVINEIEKVYEIAQVGATIDSGLGPYALFDHDKKANTGFSIKAGFNGDEVWMDYPKKSLSADIDSDGKDNVITAVFNGLADEIYLMVQQADGSFEKHYLKDSDGAEIASFDFVGDFGERPWLNDNYMMRDFTSGDFDGDRDPEFVVSCKTGIIIFDHEFNLIGSLSLPDKGSDNYPYVRVEAGDLNNDHYDDLVVINGSMKQNDQNEPGDLHILKGSSDGLGVNVTDGDIINYAELNNEMTNSITNLKFSSAEVVIFDADGDGYNELAVAGVQSDYGGSDDVFGWNCRYNVVLRYIDPYNENSGNFQYSQTDSDGDFVDDVSIGSPTSYQYWHHPRNLSIPRLVAGHFAPGEKEMVNALDLMWSINESGEWEVFDQFLYTTTDSSVFHNMVYDTVVAGDVTGNGMDELIYLTWSYLPWQNVFEGDLNQNVMNSISIWGYDDDSKTYGTLDTVRCTSSNEYPTLALANVDDDTLILEYLDHQLTYSSPQILTVMASAPYYAELGDEMDISNSVTSYAETSTNSVGSEVNWGFNVSVSVGLSVADPVTDSGIETTLTVDNSWDWSWGQMYSQYTTVGYDVNAGSDQVIFAGVPYDTYIYRVLSYGPDGDPGEFITINVPRKPQTSSVEVSFYNSLVDEEYRITDEVLNHTIGDPFSYYDDDDKTAFQAEDDILNQGWLFSAETMGVSQGSALNTLTAGKDVVSAYNFGYTLSGSFGGEVKIVFVTAGMEYGVYAGYNYTSEVGDGVEITGSVGSISDSDLWTENNFEWGIMMIPQTVAEQSFHYVTYWVEDNT